MKIWMLSDCEPLPGADHPRLMRVGLLAEAMVRAGHDVTWWSNTFDHGAKRYLYDKETEKTILDGKGNLILLHSNIVYYKNKSLSRLIFHSKLARRFAERAQTMDPPEIIFCSWPTMQFADASVRYGKRHNVPVVVDVRDLWPDIFYRAVPKGLQPLASLFIAPYERMAGRVFREVTGVTAIIQSHLKWALDKAKRPARKFDRIFYLSHEQTVLTDAERKEQLDAWRALGVTADTWNLCYFGTLSRLTYDMETVIEAFKRLHARRPDMRLVLCGDGDGMAHYKALARDCDAIVLPGWCNNAQLQSLMEICKAGIYPPRNSPDFTDSFTNKLIGYLACGLPAISCPDGFSRRYLEQYDIGLHYREGDVASFMQAAATLLDDEPRRQQMGERARARFLKDFEAGLICAKLTDYFEEILAARRP